MATITSTGIVGRSLADYRTLLENDFKSHFGSDLDVAPETVQGGLIAIMATSLTELDEAVVADANASGIDTASGSQLDDLGTILGVERQSATRSTVTLTLTGVSGTVVAKGVQGKKLRWS